MTLTTETLNTFNAAVKTVMDLVDLIGPDRETIEDSLAYEREQGRNPADLIARADAAIAAYQAANDAIGDGRGDPDRFAKWQARIHQIAGC